MATCLLLALAGCGNAADNSEETPESGEAGATLFGDCRADDPVLDQAEVVAEADLDGSGEPNQVSYVPDAGESACGNALVTSFDGKRSAMSLGRAGFDSVQVVQLEDTERQLLLVRGEAHPRGGYALVLVGGADGAIGEVRTGSGAVLQFVATDGGGLPETATCTADGGVAVLSAREHKPADIVVAWDVQRTAYRLDGNEAVETSSEQIRTAAADPLLRKEMPQLFDPEGHFADCIVEG
ncbi:MAG TPA: hypothetical protein VLA97_18200 [Nocardioidaceae bacterium]|nr:hypothetical protein [Nocardioidaceae bacterium]